MRVSQSEHALQTARLAEVAGASEPLIVAALLHDIGHLLDDQDERALIREGRDGRHETRGAALLRRFFRPEVTRPVALHVAAKQYLGAVDADYAEGLSPASMRSLELQGGPLDACQALAFERRPEGLSGPRDRLDHAPDRASADARASRLGSYPKGIPLRTAAPRAPASRFDSVRPDVTPPIA